MVIEDVIFKGHQMYIILLLSQNNLTLHLNLNYLYLKILSAILVKIDLGARVKICKSYQCIFNVIIFFPSKRGWAFVLTNQWCFYYVWLKFSQWF